LKRGRLVDEIKVRNFKINTNKQRLDRANHQQKGPTILRRPIDTTKGKYL